MWPLFNWSSEPVHIAAGNGSVSSHKSPGATDSQPWSSSSEPCWSLTKNQKLTQLCRSKLQAESPWCTFSCCCIRKMCIQRNYIKKNNLFQCVTCHFLVFTSNFWVKFVSTAISYSGQKSFAYSHLTPSRTRHWGNRAVAISNVNYKLIMAKRSDDSNMLSVEFIFIFLNFVFNLFFFSQLMTQNLSVGNRNCTKRPYFWSQPPADLLHTILNSHTDTFLRALDLAKIDSS